MKAKRDRLFENIELPKAPQELRARVVKASREARPLHRQISAGLGERLWSSTGLRLAWAVAVVVLVAAHVLISMPVKQSELAEGSSRMLADEALEELIDWHPLDWSPGEREPELAIQTQEYEEES